jgi:exopolyphosphatase / guanosine-5'-triphosphate,3'-diphosphate pyrophosphatase
MPRYAVLDVGTNSVILLVCYVQPEKGIFEVILDTTEVTRLGEGVQETGRIQPAGIERTCAAIGRFLADAEYLGAQRVVAVGTSVLRKASNSSDFIDRVKSEFGLDIEVISGDAEARYSYLAVQTDARFRAFSDAPLILIDIGGGSTELIFGRAEVTYLSIPWGAVYLTDRFIQNDPPTDDEMNTLRAFIADTLSSHIRPPTDAQAVPSQYFGEQDFRSLWQTGQTGATALRLRKSPPFFEKIPRVLVGIGGTIVNLASVKRGLARFELDVIHGETLTQQEIAEQLERFRGVNLQGRMQIPGLEPKRADVIIAGATILWGVLEYLGFEKVHVSTRGVRYGVMVDAFGVNGEKSD